MHKIWFYNSKTVSNVSPMRYAGNFNVLSVRKFIDSDTQSIISNASSHIETPVFPTTADIQCSHTKIT